MKSAKRAPMHRIGSQKKGQQELLFARLGDVAIPLDMSGSSPDALQRQVNALDTYITRLTTPSRFASSQEHGTMDVETKRLVVHAYLHRGVARALLGTWPQAQQDFARVVHLAEGTAQARTASLFLALAYDIDQGNNGLAIQGWTRLLKIIETSGVQEAEAGSRIIVVHAYVSRARLLARQGEYLQALADCDRALAHDSACAEAYSMRGAVYSHMEQGTRVEEDCSKAIELAGWPVHYYRRALVYKRQKKYQNALDDIKQACQMEPTSQLFQQEHLCILMYWISNPTEHTM